MLAEFSVSLHRLFSEQPSAAAPWTVSVPRGLFSSTLKPMPNSWAHQLYCHICHIGRSLGPFPVVVAEETTEFVRCGKAVLNCLESLDRGAQAAVRVMEVGMPELPPELKVHCPKSLSAQGIDDHIVVSLMQRGFVRSKDVCFLALEGTGVAPVLVECHSAPLDGVIYLHHTLPPHARETAKPIVSHVQTGICGGCATDVKSVLQLALDPAASMVHLIPPHDPVHHLRTEPSELSLSYDQSLPCRPTSFKVESSGWPCVSLWLSVPSSLQRGVADVELVFCDSEGDLPSFACYCGTLRPGSLDCVGGCMLGEGRLVCNHSGRRMTIRQVSLSGTAPTGLLLSWTGIHCLTTTSTINVSCNWIQVHQVQAPPAARQQTTNDSAGLTLEVYRNAFTLKRTGDATSSGPSLCFPAQEMPYPSGDNSASTAPVRALSYLLAGIGGGTGPTSTPTFERELHTKLVDSGLLSEDDLTSEDRKEVKKRTTVAVEVHDGSLTLSSLKEPMFPGTGNRLGGLSGEPRSRGRSRLLFAE